MDRKALLISALATLAGVGLLHLYMKRFEDEVRGGPSTRVLVLVKDARAGTMLSRELLGTRELPQAYLESRHVPAGDLEQVLDSKLGVAVRANDTLLITDLASMREPLRHLSSLVPEGRRAFTLGHGGDALDSLLLPGDRVDVLLVPARDGRTSEALRTTDLVAQNLLVLAVGDDLGDPSNDRNKPPRRSSSVTLSTTVEQSKALAEAERQGLLRLSLRNPDDLTISDPKAPPDSETTTPQVAVQRKN